MEGGGSGGGSSLNFRGEGVVKKRESPDFRSPEVGISACMMVFIVHPKGAVFRDINFNPL